MPLERQVRVTQREGLVVDSQTLWDQQEPTSHRAPAPVGMRPARIAPVPARAIRCELTRRTRFCLYGYAVATLGRIGLRLPGGVLKPHRKEAMLNLMLGSFAPPA
jgi:hypothetical protein